MDEVESPNCAFARSKACSAETPPPCSSIHACCSNTPSVPMLCPIAMSRPSAPTGTCDHFTFDRTQLPEYPGGGGGSGPDSPDDSAATNVACPGGPCNGGGSADGPCTRSDGLPRSFSVAASRISASRDRLPDGTLRGSSAPLLARTGLRDADRGLRDPWSGCCFSGVWLLRRDGSRFSGVSPPRRDALRDSLVGEERNPCSTTAPRP